MRLQLKFSSEIFQNPESLSERQSKFGSKLPFYSLISLSNIVFKEK